MRFAVLGPVRAWRDDVDVAVGSPQQRAVLAVLLLWEGAPVSVADLVVAVWGDAPPRTGQHTVRTYIQRLRRLLGPDVITSVSGGYSLAVPADSFDLTACRGLV